MSGKSFIRFFLSLTFVALTAVLAAHFHSHATDSSTVESKCAICLVATSSMVDGSSAALVHFDQINYKFHFDSEFISTEPALNLKARDPPCLFSI